MKYGPRRGIASELRIAADLILRGFEVYAAHRVGNTFDFIISHENKQYTVEVKTSPRLHPFPAMWKNNPDLLALIDYKGQLRYITANIGLSASFNQ